jgi:poly(3-hydroxybutyrate) depolymerase
MAEDGDEAQPRGMTLMAGPIDTRVNPTKVNKLATSLLSRTPAHGYRA